MPVLGASRGRVFGDANPNTTGNPAKLPADNSQPRLPHFPTPGDVLRETAMRGFALDVSNPESLKLKLHLNARRMNS